MQVFLGLLGFGTNNPCCEQVKGAKCKVCGSTCLSHHAIYRFFSGVKIENFVEKKKTFLNVVAQNIDCEARRF